MNTHKIWLALKEHFNEIFIGILFLIVFLGIFNFRELVFTKDLFNQYATSFVALFGIFLTWVQFLFYKQNKKKESALTYFPRPMELGELESSIDKIIGFWSRSAPLDNYEVRLMDGKSILSNEYKLIWGKLSITNKIEIIKHYDNEPDISKLEYKKKYNIFINELYKGARRKLISYLNQIEGYCLAINKGNIDSKAAKDLFAHKFYHNFRKARPYIEMVRESKGDKSIFIEFETVLRKWDCI